MFRKGFAGAVCAVPRVVGRVGAGDVIRDLAAGAIVVRVQSGRVEGHVASIPPHV